MSFNNKAGNTQLHILPSTNENNIILLFKRYDQLLRKHSWTVSGFDHDLYSECKITLMKCIRKFNFDEKGFQELFSDYLASRKSN